MTEAQKLEHLKKLATLMRYYILTMTTQAGLRPPHVVPVGHRTDGRPHVRGHLPVRPG